MVGFYVLVDLFGAADLIHDRARDALAQPEVARFTRELGLEQTIAIGASQQEPDVFLLVGPVSKVLPEGVIWWADEAIDRFDDFAAFFSAMTATPTDPDATEGVEPTEADNFAHPEQLPMDDDASGLPDDEAEQLGDFA
jgi:hypothetical protein